MGYIVILSIVIVIIVIMCNFEILSLLNSHFGNNYSTKESDINKNKNTNWINSLYEKKLTQYFTDSGFTKYVEPNSVPTVDIKDLTREKFFRMSKNLCSPIVVKGFFKNGKNIVINRYNRLYHFALGCDLLISFLF